MYDVQHIAEEPLLLDAFKRAVAGEPPAFLRSAKIKVTARCNLKCVMCKYGRGWAPPELDGARFVTLMSELADLGCRKVHFSGGEVLARSDFERIVARAAERRMKVALSSNLTLLTKERAKSLMRHKINSVSTSLDGATSKTHEKVRGVPGAFKKTLAGMRYLARERARRGRRTRLRVNFVMMRANHREYPELVRLAGDHGATEVHPMPVDTKSDKLRLSKRMIRVYNEDIAPQVYEVRRAYGMSTEKPFVYPFGRTGLELAESASGGYAGGYYRDHLCYAPYLHLFVAWDGNVYLCCMTNGRMESLGNVSMSSLEAIYGGQKFQETRRAMESARLPSCHACDMFLAENKALALALSGRESSSP